ncbi:MAG: hypothetical protein PHQ22_07175 [Sulfuricurvum sp.]|nr:hypothetical protein [Sulfuricurvum sp.]MDD5386959.1 hypothetical protein [Sulfuricurvum sp.]
MAYTLHVKNPCRCFLRDGGIETQSFGSTAQAKEEAEALYARMEKNYCKKHRFVLTQMAGNYTITIQPRPAG